MLAVMISVGMGRALTPMFIVEVIIIVMISSFGVAGVGGGSVIAALVVLSALDLPVALAGVLISVDVIIGLGLTSVNVSGAILSGVITAKRRGELDLEVFNSVDNEKDFVVQ